MEILKQELERTEAECEVINRREKLLNIKVTKFSTVTTMQAEVKPFIQLWSIAESYTRVYESKIIMSLFKLFD
jgi:hypothetical protein